MTELTKEQKIAQKKKELAELEKEKIKMVKIRAIGPGVLSLDGKKIPIGDVVEVSEDLGKYLENNIPKIATMNIKEGKLVDIGKKEEKGKKDKQLKDDKSKTKTVEKKK